MFGGDVGLARPSSASTFPSPLWFAKGLNVHGYGGKSVQARFDKQTLISLVLLRAPWQVFFSSHSKDRPAAWLVALCGPQPPLSLTLGTILLFHSTTSHVYNSNPLGDVCIGVPSCAWSSLYSPLLLLLTPSPEATHPKPALSGGYWQICLASNMKFPIWLLYSEG